MSDSPAIDRTVRQNDGLTSLSSRHIRCETCKGYVDDRWYPRCHTSANEVQITGRSTATSDDSSNGNSDATEREDEQEIFSMCYECNEKVQIQMKING